MSPPYVSVVIPTRDRPAFLREALRSLRRQTFRDFEVIVCDNHTREPGRAVFDEYATDGWRYVKPDHPIAMHDNWELAVGQARGQYVAVVIDKTILIPSALEILHRLTERDPVDLVTWRNEDFSVIPGDGFHRYTPDALGVQAPARFDPRAALADKMSFAISRSAQGVQYYTGKICFGAYHRRLIDRIVATQGRLFHPACPDYTSMTAALACADSALDVGAPLLISFTTEISNGARCGLYPSAMEGFLTQTDPTRALLDAMPLSGLYTSTHNLVAHDYATSKARLGARMDGVELDRANLVARVAEDLHAIVWESPEQRRAQYAILRRAFDALPVADRVRVAAEHLRFLLRTRAPHALKELLKARMPRVASAAQQVLRARRGATAPPPPLTCPSIVEASSLADAAYRPRLL